jgi:putative nucleotidyltransferase with HDIG domain
MINKTYKSGIYVILSIFILSFSLSLLAIYWAGVWSGKIVIIFFFTTLFSSSISVAVLGGFYTSFIQHLLHLRRLFRLDNLSNSLLLRLSEEAPGTYHHSIIVANLASKAAKEIGADSLLCRVGSYFHDIGKLENPHFFIENHNPYQYDDHFEIKLNSPEKNAQVIINHVKNGIKIAEEMHLPKEIVNLIAQHHGDSLCSYFYDIAKKQNPLGVKKADFQYPGPKPQSKEAAILMLADSLEASARVKEGYSSIKNLVDNVFSDKMREQQLQDCGLSEKEIARLKKSFIASMESLLHPRIEYPQ